MRSASIDPATLLDDVDRELAKRVELCVVDDGLVANGLDDMSGNALLVCEHRMRGDAISAPILDRHREQDHLLLDG